MRRTLGILALAGGVAACSHVKAPAAPTAVDEISMETGEDAITILEKPAFDVPPNTLKCREKSNPRLDQLEAIRKRTGSDETAHMADEAIAKERINQIATCCVAVAHKTMCWEGKVGVAKKAALDNSVVINKVDKPTGEEDLIRVVRYPFLKKSPNNISVNEYWEYLMAHIDSAEVAGMFIHALINYDDAKLKKDAEDRLFMSGSEILEMGKGICGDISNLMKEILLRLGKKIGHNFKPKVIGLTPAKHAIVVFLDKDGKWKGFDQHMPFEEIKNTSDGFDLYSATGLFAEHRPKGTSALNHPSLFYEVQKPDDRYAGLGARTDVYDIDQRTLKSDYTLLKIHTRTPMDLQRNPGDYYTEQDWKKFKQVEVVFLDITLIYQNGKLIERAFKDGKGRVAFEKIDSQTGLIEQRTFRNGDFELFDIKGVLKQRTYANGDYETYIGGQLEQKIYKNPSNPVDFEVFGPGGKVVERHFRDGRVEILK